jgi:hypothetical protein
MDDLYQGDVTYVGTVIYALPQAQRRSGAGRRPKPEIAQGTSSLRKKSPMPPSRGFIYANHVTHEGQVAGRDRAAVIEHRDVTYGERSPMRRQPNFADRIPARQDML